MSSENDPKISTYKDKGAKLDYVKLSNGREIFIFQEEQFRGIEVGGVRLGWSNKYQVISPNQLTAGTLSLISGLVTKASGGIVDSSDISVVIGEKKISKEDIKKRNS